jgi:16S rRNA (adenine1518-N6/adenine1519-N6)-dimethyltransferase
MHRSRSSNTPSYQKSGRIHTGDYTLRKSLGQHFLHDEAVCQQIVESITLTPGLKLLEVGPGGGALTKYLIELPDVDFRAIELDEEKIEYLQRTYPVLEGRILHRDILQSLPPFETVFTVVGNFPYNISTPILFHLLEWEGRVEEVVGMFQKEVAQRIAAGPGSKDYGIPSVGIGAYFAVDYLFDVPPTAFTPPPNVTSGVIRLTALGNPHSITNRKKFMTLVKAAFGQRRKTLRNALRGTLPPEMLSDPRMDKRAEQLAIADFVDLYKIWEAA